MNVSDIDIPEFERRKRLITLYFENYGKFLKLCENSKASEMLWGIINNLVWMLGNLIDNKDIRSHSGIISYMNTLFSLRAIDMKDNVTFANDLHRNFFHDQLGLDIFNIYRKKVEELIDKLQEILSEELETRNINL